MLHIYYGRESLNKEKFMYEQIRRRGYGLEHPVLVIVPDQYTLEAERQAFQWLEKPALYGHSDGGIIALLLELRHPGTLGAMAISGTNLSPEGLIPSFIEEYTQINQETPDPLVTLMLTEPHIDPEELEKIHIPVLVTAGENDLVLREETERIAAHLPDARMVIVPDADHGSYLADSPLMGEMLLDFLAEKWTQ